MLKVTDYKSVVRVLKEHLRDTDRFMFNGLGCGKNYYGFDIYKKHYKKAWKHYKKGLKKTWDMNFREEEKFEHMTDCVATDRRCGFLREVWKYVSADDAYKFLCKWGYDISVEVNDYIDMLRELKEEGVVRGIRSDVKYVYQLRDKRRLNPADELYWCKDWVHALSMRYMWAVLNASDVQLLRTEAKDELILMESLSEGYILDYEKMKEHKIEFIMLNEAGNETWKEYER